MVVAALAAPFLAAMLNIVRRGEDGEPLLTVVSTRRPVHTAPIVEVINNVAAVPSLGIMELRLLECEGRSAVREAYQQWIFETQRHAFEEQIILETQRARKAASVYHHNSEVIGSDLVKELYDCNKHLRGELEQVVGALLGARQRNR